MQSQIGATGCLARSASKRDVLGLRDGQQGRSKPGPASPNRKERAFTMEGMEAMEGAGILMIWLSADCRFSTTDRGLPGKRRDAVARGVHWHGHMEPQRGPLSEKVIGCAIEVHRVLGPGLLELGYEQCLAREFTLHGLRAVWQAPLPSVKGVVLPIHHAQILTYLAAEGEARPPHQLQLATSHRWT